MIDLTFWRGKTVLITGHNGFKGTWLSLMLSQYGANVYGISLPSNSSENHQFSELASNCIYSESLFDIRDFNALQKDVISINPDVVFHLAAQP